MFAVAFDREFSAGALPRCAAAAGHLAVTSLRDAEQEPLHPDVRAMLEDMLGNQEDR